MNRFIFLYCLLLVTPKPSFAWGSNGHKIIATIAYNLLDNKTKDSLQKYLGSISIQDASIWMDEVRGDPAYGYLRPMHYINIEKNQSINDAPTPNIITELNVVISEIKNRNKISREKVAKNSWMLCRICGEGKGSYCAY